MATFIVWTMIFAMVASLMIIIENLVKFTTWLHTKWYNKTHYKRRV